ncbi:MAG: error-prone DNA polymerase [Gammaproteobacteria bacterium]|nr:error-prone DNA polymerase [Gammaproteobacteria bacterium]MDH3372226.1 error-prone DNA polymerase [Gammaproteobacteria bacterium]MDH3408446.1 error-prone DNA polymerase [Gammaproteobacteria bacterium]MDH3551206.1 error-prone DNA polymerase [Gammaproteobacteria bacterium]
MGHTRYAELHALSNFTFLRGASHPEELVETAAALGYEALAITDECTMSGIVRAHTAAKEHGLKKLIIGSELRLRSGRKLVALAQNQNGYAALCGLITKARRAADKGSYELTRRAFEDGLMDCVVLWVPDDALSLDVEDHWIRETFRDRLWIAVELLADGQQRRQLKKLYAEGRRLKLPLVACGDVHMHCRSRRILQDTLTAIREGVTVDNAGFALYPNGERHLRSLEVLKHVYPQELLAEGVRIAETIDFSLDELCYEYPDEIVPDGETPASYLRYLTEQGMRRRWPDGIPDKVIDLVEHELELIAELRYEPYFLTVYDIVAFARAKKILCQGRGSAANSAVCYCLGITEVDPGRMATLVERFISKERDEPPDIDVDFEHERREEVIQYIYGKYGRDRAALAATIITYRPRSALRDVGKALGLSDLQVGRLARSMQWWDGQRVDDSRVLEAGLDPDSPIIKRLLYLVREILGFPRHLSQHVGGFVISKGPLSELVPVENAAMPDRTVIQWEKTDLEDLGLLKVDVLGLGMLTAIRRSFDLLREFDGQELTLATVPAEDPVVYDMICDGDTMGVFQIESRAQMAMLPRLRPRCYYDLVIEVAIIRPGPIQGDMVHPYLRRRNGEEAVDYPSDDVKGVLQRTLGVPIFQEQVMQLAVVAAGFTPGEADQLRRAMAAWKRRGGLGPFEDKLIAGMRERGYEEQFARQIFRQIEGFGEYGFPESHSASFALLVYVSSWLKCHEPAAFTAALLNSQPMGFYSASQLTQDVRRHGVEVRAVDINRSQWDCTLEARDDGAAALRLGFRMVKGLAEEAGRRVVERRDAKGYHSIQQLLEEVGLDRRELGVLASAGALEVFEGHRHRARWAVAGAEKPTPLLTSLDRYEAAPLLRKPTEGQDIVADYQSLGLTLGRHPLHLLRHRLARYRYLQAERVPDLRSGANVRVAGLVITKQRPGTASGVTFVTLEDETGHINLIVWKQVAEDYRAALLNARLMGVQGELQIEGQVIHVIARKLIDHTDMLGNLVVTSRDFR